MDRCYFVVRLAAMAQNVVANEQDADVRRVENPMVARFWFKDRHRSIPRPNGTPQGHVAAVATSVVRPESVKRRAFLAGFFAIAFAAMPGRVMAEHGTFQQVDGLVIYFVIVPTAFVLGHPAEHTGRGMHGDTPDGRYVHHLLVALFDAATGVRITNASVTAVVQGGRQPSETRVELLPMTIGGAQAYGGFATLPPRDRYRVEIQVVRPSDAAPVRAVFSHQHLQP
jgi:hypothetical protein